MILSAVKRLSRFVLNDEEAFAKELQALWNEKQTEKPKHNKSELHRFQKRYDELSKLIRGLYENLVSGLLPERQYKQLMKQYDDEQAELETKIEEMEKELTEEKVNAVDIKHFISLIRKCKEPTEISDLMFAELIDKIVVYRTNGSIDIAGAARSILAITRTPNKEAPAERYMVQVKSNLAPTGSAILFEVAEKGVDFISEMEMTAEEAFQSLAPKMGRPNDKEIKAKEFLLEMLKDGEMLSSDCEERLEAAGFKKSTIKKAKKKAGVISKKKGFLWYWSLPMGDIPRE